MGEQAGYWLVPLRSVYLRRVATADDPNRRRQMIFDAAKVVFAEKGFSDFTIADIARKSGLSYGSITWHFPSKEALLRDLLQNEQERLRVVIFCSLLQVGSASGGANIETLLRASVSASLEFFDEDPGVMASLLQSPFSMEIGAYFRPFYDGFLDDVEALIRTGQERGELRDVSSCFAAVTLVSLILQTARWRLVARESSTVTETADVIVSFTLDGLRCRS